MHDKRIGRRYAKALFSTALKHDVVDSVEGDLAGISALLKNDARFRNFLLAPYMGREEKMKIIDRIFSDRITALTMRVLRLVLEKRREAELPSILSEFETLRREHDGIVYIKVTTSESIPDDQKANLLSKLSVVLGKKIEPEFDIDPKLIGGLRVAYENNIIDGSAKGTLGRMRERLRYDLLKRLN